MVFTGMALDQLSLEPYSGCSFPLVRTLGVRFHPKRGLKKNLKISSATIEANIGAFMDRLRQMAPKVREVKIISYQKLNYPSNAAKLQFGSLVTQLHQLAKRMQLHNYANYFPAIQVDSIRDLAYLHCTVRDGCNLVMQMAQRNALTLQHLILRIPTDTNVAGLVRDAGGGYTVYPCLHSLELCDINYGAVHVDRVLASLGHGIDVPPLPVFPGATPFPVLRRLRFDTHYPFGDDTLFRGNAATLEHLDMRLYFVTVNMLREYNVFAPDSHPKLCCVQINNMLTPTEGKFATDAAFMEFVLGIGSRASVRRILFKPLEADIQPALSLFGNHICIQKLMLPKTPMSLWDAFVLIKSLPLLSDLHTWSLNLDPLPAGATRSELSDYVRSNYTAISKRFRCWCNCSQYVTLSQELFECALLLAHACPNFGCVIMSFEYRAYLTEMSASAFAGPYGKHAARLILQFFF
ncbi:hypothetical protein GGF42_001809 [Coemansia sp. RSA 2424]|nr:hypothetical protein GGF42_001809 [Coemansia sp. RSA 2424]